MVWAGMRGASPHHSCQFPQCATARAARPTSAVLLVVAVRLSRGVIFSPGTTQRAADAHIFRVLFGLFVALTGIARRKLDGLLRFDSRLQLPAAFDLGVKLRPKKQRDVRDPHPEQENDHTTDRPVRLVVAREVRRVERESGRGEHPHH